MTKKIFSMILLAVLTALMLAGCGRIESSSPESSDTIEMQTWGDTIDPNATPSMGQVMPEVLNPEQPDVVQGGTTTLDGQDNVTQPETTGDNTTEPPETTATPSSSSGSSSGSNGGTSSPSPSPSPSDSPSIAPPAPASSATVDDVQAYVGKTLTELIENLGYPLSSDYQLVDEEDPQQGEKGTLYFDGFTATTLRKDGTETITGVTVTTSEASEEPTES